MTLDERLEDTSIQDSLQLDEEEDRFSKPHIASEEVTGLTLLRRYAFWLVFFVHLFSAGMTRENATFSNPRDKSTLPTPNFFFLIN